MLNAFQRISLVEWLIVLVSSIALGLTWYLGVWRTEALITLGCFVFGQWVIVFRHAGQEMLRQRAWANCAGAVLTAVQVSVDRHLLSVARNRNLEIAYESTPVAFKPDEYEEHMRQLLERLAVEDFPSAPGEVHPLKHRLLKLRGEIMEPMRELVRWGVTVERVYSAKDREEYCARTMLLAVLEMVLTHYLAEIDAILRTASRWPTAAPDAVKPDAVRFVVLEREGCDLRFSSRPYVVPPSANRVARALNSLGEPLVKLGLVDKIPGLPVSDRFHPGDEDFDRAERRFCTEYLSLVWHRTIVVLVGERLVSLSHA